MDKQRRFTLRTRMFLLTYFNIPDRTFFSDRTLEKVLSWDNNIFTREESVSGSYHDQALEKSEQFRDHDKYPIPVSEARKGNGV